MPVDPPWRGKRSRGWAFRRKKVDEDDMLEKLPAIAYAPSRGSSSTSSVRSPEVQGLTRAVTRDSLTRAVNHRARSKTSPAVIPIDIPIAEQVFTGKKEEIKILSTEPREPRRLSRIQRLRVSMSSSRLRSKSCGSNPSSPKATKWSWFTKKKKPSVRSSRSQSSPSVNPDVQRFKIPDADLFSDMRELPSLYSLSRTGSVSSGPNASTILSIHGSSTQQDPVSQQGIISTDSCSPSPLASSRSTSASFVHSPEKERKQSRRGSSAQSRSGSSAQARDSCAPSPLASYRSTSSSCVSSPEKERKQSRKGSSAQACSPSPLAPSRSTSALPSPERERKQSRRGSSDQANDEANKQPVLLALSVGIDCDELQVLRAVYGDDSAEIAVETADAERLSLIEDETTAEAKGLSAGQPELIVGLNRLSDPSTRSPAKRYSGLIDEADTTKILRLLFEADQLVCYGHGPEFAGAPPKKPAPAYCRKIEDLPVRKHLGPPVLEASSQTPPRSEGQLQVESLPALEPDVSRSEPLQEQEAAATTCLNVLTEQEYTICLPQTADITPRLSLRLSEEKSPERRGVPLKVPMTKENRDVYSPHGYNGISPNPLFSESVLGSSTSTTMSETSSTVFEPISEVEAETDD